MSDQHSALGMFTAGTADASALAGKITNYLNDHMHVAPEDINWGHVGTLNQVHLDLQAIAAFLGLPRG
jgi:hypothetical protein